MFLLPPPPCLPAAENETGMKTNELRAEERGRAECWSKSPRADGIPADKTADADGTRRRGGGTRAGGTRAGGTGGRAPGGGSWASAPATP